MATMQASAQMHGVQRTKEMICFRRAESGVRVVGRVAAS